MAEQTGIYALLDDLGDAAEDLARIYAALVAAGLIRGEVPEVTPPYVPEPEPWYKNPYLPIGLAVAVAGGAGLYYVAKRKR